MCIPILVSLLLQMQLVWVFFCIDDSYSLIFFQMLLILQTEDCLDGIQDSGLLAFCVRHAHCTALTHFRAVGRQSQSLKETPPMAMRHLTWACQQHQDPAPHAHNRRGSDYGKPLRLAEPSPSPPLRLVLLAHEFCIE